MIKNFNALLFESPTEEWDDFMMNNRTNKDFNHDFDVVYGPVANDKVYAAFALYEGGIIDKQNLISELKAYKLVDQYLFHTEKALMAVKFIEAKEVTLCKNECPIEGHTFLPDKKARNPACPSLHRCKQYQDENDGSVKTFRVLSIKASTNVVNETENRLLKSEKDS